MQRYDITGMSCAASSHVESRGGCAGLHPSLSAC